MGTGGRAVTPPLQGLTTPSPAASQAVGACREEIPGSWVGGSWCVGAAVAALRQMSRTRGMLAGSSLGGQTAALVEVTW